VVLVGLAFGLATKRSLVMFLPGVLVALVAWRPSLGLRLAPQAIALMVVAGGLLLSVASIGLRRPGLPMTGVQATIGAYALDWPGQVDRVLHPPVSRSELVALVGLQADALFKSFWAMFGWFNLPFSAGLNALLLVFSAVAGAGCIIWLVQREMCALRAGVPAPAVRLMLAYGTIIASTLVAAVAEALSYFTAAQVPQGRYLFGAVVPVALVYVIGTRFWLSRSRFGVLAPTLVIVLLLILLDVVAYRDYFAPYYVGRAFQ
jgi:hypothetical protein